MSIQLASTTASPDEVKQALESAGHAVESLETLSTEVEEPAAAEEAAQQEESAASADDLGSEEPEGDGEGEIEDASAASEQERDEQGKFKGKAGRGFHKRIQKLESHLSERDQTIADLKRQLEEIQQARKTEEKPPEPAAKTEEPPPNAAPTPKPTIEDANPDGTPKYEGAWDPKFIDDLTDWKDEQKTAKLRAEIDKLRSELNQKDEERKAADVQAEASAAWVEKVEAVKADYPDWDQVAGETDPAKVAPLSDAMASAIFEDENGPRVLHYLATHLDEAKKVFAATNHKADATPEEIIRANRAVGREYARIATLAMAEAKPAEKPAEPATEPPVPPAKPKPKASTAPPPIKPAKTATTQGTPDTPFDRPMTHQEYKEWWNRTHPKK